MELILLDVDMCKDIARMGRSVIIALITDSDNFLRDDDTGWTETGKELLLMAGTTPIVSKECDPSCMVSYAADLIRRIKIEGWNERDMEIVQHLVCHGDCVDKDV